MHGWGSLAPFQPDGLEAVASGGKRHSQPPKKGPPPSAEQAASATDDIWAWRPSRCRPGQGMDDVDMEYRRSRHVSMLPLVAIVLAGIVGADSMARVTMTLKRRKDGRLPYDPRRGGHAPDDLRRAFDDWVEDGMQDGMVGARLFAGGPRPARWLLELLHNCSDTLPGHVANELEGVGAIRMGMRRSYAAAARGLRNWRAWDDPRGSGTDL